MAKKIKCLTSGAIYHTSINEKKIGVSVDLPIPIRLTKKEAKVLEKLLHNQMELVLRLYFETDSCHHTRIRPSWYKG